MEKISEAQLERYKKLSNPITNEIHHELALRAIRTLSGSIWKEEQETEFSLEIVALRKAILQQVQIYEQKEYPFGEPTFRQWTEGLTDEIVEKKLEEIKQAEDLVDRMGTF